MPTNKIISVKGLGKDFFEFGLFGQGKMIASSIKDISFDVKQGDIFGLLGTSGAGKSTVTKILTTRQTKTAGTVKIAGFDLDKEPDKIRESISWMIAGLSFTGYKWVSIEKNLQFAASLRNIPQREARPIIEQLLKEFDLYDQRKIAVWRMSTGMKARFGIIVALLTKPKVLFLDEPLMGLDIENKDTVRKHIQKLNSEGVTIVFTSHQLNEVEKICNNIVILDKGHIIYNGGIADLKNRYKDVSVIKFSVSGINAIELVDKLSKHILNYNIVTETEAATEVRIFTKHAVNRMEKILQKECKKNSLNYVMNEQLTLELGFDFIVETSDTTPIVAKAHDAFRREGFIPPQMEKEILSSKDSLVKQLRPLVYWSKDRKKSLSILSAMLKKHNEMLHGVNLVGELKAFEFSSDLLSNFVSRDVQLSTASAISLAKMGYYYNILLFLVEKLFDPDVVDLILDELEYFDGRMLTALQIQIGKKSTKKLQELVKRITEHSKKEKLFELLSLTEDIHG